MLNQHQHQAAHASAPVRPKPVLGSTANVKSRNRLGSGVEPAGQCSSLPAPTVKSSRRMATLRRKQGAVRSWFRWFIGCAGRPNRRPWRRGLPDYQRVIRSTLGAKPAPPSAAQPSAGGRPARPGVVEVLCRKAQPGGSPPDHPRWPPHDRASARANQVGAPRWPCRFRRDTWRSGATADLSLASQAGRPAAGKYRLPGECTVGSSSSTSSTIHRGPCVAGGAGTAPYHQEHPSTP